MGLELFTRQSNQERLGCFKVRERPLSWTPHWPERSQGGSQAGGTLDPPSLMLLGGTILPSLVSPECLSTTVRVKYLALFSRAPFLICRLSVPAFLAQL